MYQKMKIQPALRYVRYNAVELMSLSLGHAYFVLSYSPIPPAPQVLKLQPLIKQPTGGKKSFYLYLTADSKLLEGSS